MTDVKYGTWKIMPIHTEANMFMPSTSSSDVIVVHVITFMRPHKQDDANCVDCMKESRKKNSAAFCLR